MANSTVQHSDGSTSYTNTSVAESEVNDDDITANLPNFIGNAAENAADNANGNIAGTEPKLEGYMGR